MYCSNCGHKTDKSDTFCANCGQKLKQSVRDSDKPLFKQISLTALDLMSAQGDKWRRNTELLPADCWMLFMNVGKAQAGMFINKNNLNINDKLKDKIEKIFFNSYSWGIWIWVAIKKHTDPKALSNIHFKYDDITKNANKFIDEWERNLDNIGRDIGEEIKPAFAIAQVKMEDAIDNDKLLGKNLSAGELLNLKSDLLGSIYRGYYLHKYL